MSKPLSTYKNLENEDSFWELLQANNDTEARVVLVNHYMPYARNVAALYYRKSFYDSVEFSDYFHLAVVGLIEAIDRYDYKQDAKFLSFANYRIKGSILDGTKKLTEYRGQSAYLMLLKKERLLSLQEINFSKEYASEKNTFDEMADLTLGLALGNMLAEESLLEYSLMDETYKNGAISELKKKMLLAVDDLPVKESLVIQYHYFSHTKFDDIAKFLKITKGRVSQLHKHGLLLLHKKLAQYDQFCQYF